MAPSFDCAISNLLCQEELDAESDCNLYACDRRGSFDNGVVPACEWSEDCLFYLLEHESSLMASDCYLKKLRSGDSNSSARSQTVDWIAKVHEHFGFGHLCFCLSINYMDRFLSSYERNKDKAWMMQLLAVACISIAAKLEEPQVPQSVDLQVGEAKYIFEARTIQRMELLVLSTLNWRMKAVTPFCFIEHFLHIINNGESPSLAMTFTSTKLILSIIRVVDFLEFKPSEIAAAVAAAVCRSRADGVEQAISSLQHHVNKEKVLNCIELIDGLSLMHEINFFDPSPMPPPSPNGVLEAACYSYKSDETLPCSCPASPHAMVPDTKRRKMEECA